MMAKGLNDGKNKRSRNYKPYDSNNSFVKRVASRVSELIPLSLSRWLTSSQDITEQCRFENEEEGQHPPKKIRLDQTPNDYSHQNNIGQFTKNCSQEVDVSPILRGPLDDFAIPGPSGLHIRKNVDNFVSSTPALSHVSDQPPPKTKIHDAVDDGSDSSDSTSGCSSLIPQSDKAQHFSSFRTLRSVQTSNLSSHSESSRNTLSKTTYPRVDFSHSSTMGVPVFDPVIFNSPFRCRSMNSSLKDDLNKSSPFYRGRTMYGGASSCREALTFPSSSPSRTIAPRVMNIRPEESVTVRDSMGDTAKRILEALEKFSSPVLDAKRIQMRQPPLSGQKRKLPRPYQELNIPQMPDLLRIKRRESQHKRNLSLEMATEEPSTSNNVIRISEDSLGNKLEEDRRNTKRVETSQKFQVEDKNERSKEETEVAHQDISTDTTKLQSHYPLPIISLPVIDISVSKPSALPLKSPLPNPTILPPVSINNTSPNNGFKFSEPISQSSKISSPLISVSLKSSYKFSLPINPKEGGKKKTSLSGNSNLKNITSQEPPPIIEKTNNLTNISSIMKSGSPNFKLKRKVSVKNGDSENTVIPSSATELKSGSVMDFFKSNAYNKNKEKFSVSAKCTKCKVNVEKDRLMCSACESSNLNKKEVLNYVKTTPVEIKLNSNIDKWKCIKCSFENATSDVKCVKCGLNKGGKLEVTTNDKEASKSDGFESFYKPPKDTWECKECFVRNKISEMICAACSSPKEGTQVPKQSLPSLNSLFKKSEGSWECSTCLVSNKSGIDTCVACGTLKPGAVASTETSKPTFSFGIPSSTHQEDTTKNGGIAFSFGASANAKDSFKLSSTGFTFGAKDSETKNESVQPSSFKFGVNESDDSKKLTFSFGSSSEQKEEKESKPKKEPNSVCKPPDIPVTSNNFNFKSNYNDEPKGKDSEEKKDPPKKHVSFGEPLITEKITSTTSQPSVSSNFIFGNPQTKNESTSKFSFPPTTTTVFTTSINSEPVTSTSSQPNFNFGAIAATKSETTEAPKATATFNFISSSTGTFASQNKSDKPLFGFLMENSKPEAKLTFSSGSNADPKENATFESVDKAVLPKKNNLFGNNENTPNTFAMGNNEEKKINFFGPSNAVSDSKPSFFNNNAISESKSVFGNVQVNTWNAKPNFTSANETTPFGAVPTTTTASFSGFGTPSQLFTTNNGERTNSTTPFSFNAVTNQQPSSNSVFSFKTDTENKPQGFSFGTAATTQPSTGGFNFTVPQTTTANSFGSNFNQTPAQVTPAPMFGNPNPVFGSTAPTQQPAPFQFASPPQQQEQPHPPSAPTPLFGFSAQTQPTSAPTPPSFSFGSQNATGPAATPSFDPNIKPSFNFTGGATPSFSATPTAGVVKPERKIRRAVRRTNR